MIKNGDHKGKCRGFPTTATLHFLAAGTSSSWAALTPPSVGRASMRPTMYLPVALILSLIGAQPAWGQRGERLPTLSAEQCAQAARTARLRARGTYGEAVFALGLCPDRGPEALLAEWAARPADRDDLYALGEASRTLRDQRLLEGIGRMALADETPRELRHALVNVLVGYIARGIWFTLEDGCWQLGVSTGAGPVADGAQPLDRSRTGRRVIEIVRALEDREVLVTSASCPNRRLSRLLESEVSSVRPDVLRPPIR